MKPKRRPMNRAIAGLTKGRKHAAMPMKNSDLLKIVFINMLLRNCSPKFTQ